MRPPAVSNSEDHPVCKNWVVRVRDPVKDHQQFLDYLPRYTHRAAIANGRIPSHQDGGAMFSAKD